MMHLKNYFSIFLFTVFYLCQQFSVAQNKNSNESERALDSLNQSLKLCKEDTNKVNTLNAFAWEIKTSNADSAIKTCNLALALAEKLQWEKGIAISFSKLGVYYAYYKADYPKALNCCLAALKLTEQLNLKQLQANILGNIGFIHKMQADYEVALSYYHKSLKIFEELKNKKGISKTLLGLANLYWTQSDLDKALDFSLRALIMSEELGDKSGISTSFSLIGSVYFSRYDFQKALEYYLKALKINEEIGDRNGMANAYGNIGSIYGELKKYREAEEYLIKAIALSSELKNLASIKTHEKMFSELYERTGRPELALEHYKKYIAIRDSIDSQENQKKQIQAEMNFEFGKKEAVMKEQQEKERVVAAEKSRFQKIVISSVLICLLLVIGFSFFVFRTLKKTRLQKYIIEEKQREILDSIRYAKRIQNALLTSEKYIERNWNRLKTQCN
ncbi:MAG: tetratricopeptide repeat protein [Bacteroidia bacterium]|nr:tetratricopeptide repeat protein [Bacteroidia bacterium]